MSHSRWDDQALRDGLRQLHRVKSLAYAGAWKRRGEVLSILANVARKVDRLEAAMNGAPAGSDEGVLDTAIDLVVYCLKYQTYLADQDAAVAEQLGLGGQPGPHSDGVAAFERLLQRLDFPPPKSAEDQGGAISAVLRCFVDLEACFAGLTPAQAGLARLVRLAALTEAGVALVTTLLADDQAYRRFLSSNSTRTD